MGGRTEICGLSFAGICTSCPACRAVASAVRPLLDKSRPGSTQASTLCVCVCACGTRQAGALCTGLVHRAKGRREGGGGSKLRAHPRRAGKQAGKER